MWRGGRSNRRATPQVYGPVGVVSTSRFRDPGRSGLRAFQARPMNGPERTALQF